jgi:hypothetical protein
VEPLLHFIPVDLLDRWTLYVAFYIMMTMIVPDDVGKGVAVNT